MSIQSEIERITANVANAYSVLERLGATMPSVRNTDNLPETIESCTEDLNDVLTEQESLIAELKAVLQGKAAGDGVAQPTQTKTVDITENGTTQIVPDDGYVLSKVTARVNVPIPDDYVKPSGTMEIVTNGTYDVTVKKSVAVNVPIPNGYIKPNGSKEITTNGTHDVTDKESVIVNVPEREIILQDKEITENGTYTVDSGYDGLGQVVVNIPPVEVALQSKTVTPTKAIQEVTADANYTALDKVTVEAIPSNYIVPSGTLEVNENGTHDVTGYSSVIVDVPTSGGGDEDEEPDYRDLYQRVEYITSAEADTYPYIITDFIADNSCGLEVVASFPKLQDRIPMGSRLDSNATRFYCVYPMSANSIYYGFNTGSSISCALKVDTIYRLQTNFLNSRLVNVYDENGIRKGGTSLSATLAQQSVPVSIFGYNNASTGAVTSKREFKLYSARCSRGHEVVRDYIPCYRKSDGEIGLYEKITGQFLLGSGEFIKGADVEW